MARPLAFLLAISGIGEVLMAVLALGFVGTAIGGSIGGTILGVSAAAIGGFVGSTVGGLIDNMLFAGTTKVEGPRIDDLKVTASTYGSPIPLVYGPENRLAGNIIWSTGLIESTTKKKSGGKGGGGGAETTTYSYRASLAIALADGFVEGVKKIRANGKVIFDIDAATVPPDAPTPDVGMVADQSNGTHAVFETVRFYQGNGTQIPDPTIEAHLGAGETPAYRHTCYIVLTDLQLADFGNVIPNLEFDLVAHESILVSTVAKDICRRAGVEEASAGSLDEPLRGYVVSRGGTAVAALEPLALAYRFDVAEQRGQIRMIRRGGMMRGTVAVGDMGAREASSDPAEPVRFDRMPDIQMPREAAVSFLDPAIDYEPNTQRSSRSLGNSENNLSHELPLTLDADEGRGVADRLLWEAWNGRRAARFSVSDRWIRVNAGDVVGVPIAGEVVPFKVQRVTRGANGVIEMEARYEDPEIYAPIAPGTPGNIPANPLRLPGITILVAMDMPIVRSTDDDAGFYWVATGPSPGWRGARILRSSDGGSTYNPMSPVSVRAVIGDVAGTLPAGPAYFWDRGNVLTVELLREADELESLPELAVLGGQNAAWIGDPDGQDGEIIQFASAQLVAPGVYNLTDLLRGRLGTEHAIGNHGPGEMFVLLEPDTLGRTDYGVGDWFKQRLYKPVSVLTNEADTAAQSFTNNGEGKRPLSPVHIRGTRNDVAGSPPAPLDDLTVTWTRRSRLLAPGLGYGPVPLGEETEAYEVDILDGANVVRTIASSVPSIVYTEAEQIADGLTPGAPVTLRVYQMSSVRGRGRPAQATV